MTASEGKEMASESCKKHNFQKNIQIFYCLFTYLGWLWAYTMAKKTTTICREDECNELVT